MSMRTDDPNYGGPRRQAWGPRQGYVTNNTTEAHLLRPRKTPVNKRV